jgi:hypothetical protein
MGGDLAGGQLLVTHQTDDFPTVTLGDGPNRGFHGPHLSLPSHDFSSDPGSTQEKASATKRLKSVTPCQNGRTQGFAGGYPKVVVR